MLTDSLWIFVAASLLHFGYSLTRFYPLSFICAVNESIWEHTKIVFFGALFYNLIQYLLKGKSSPCLIAGLAPALFSILVTVPFLYYGYTGMLGFYVFLLDLTIAWVSGLICQIILYRVSGIEGCSGYQTLSLLFVILLVLVFFFSHGIRPGDCRCSSRAAGHEPFHGAMQRLNRMITGNRVVVTSASFLFRTVVAAACLCSNTCPYRGLQ